ncbi:two-component system histidine kinase PnpS [Alkalicoccus daliensis]|uniref:histidine kinase n=1 Tax=Alkalicoccus daliensis TaxID=745820 RepID=A0A1H0CDR8_9BACI|nr:ATP-binding protein [Alkalicoccus daliensis]SDN55956.1 PAS/PAC sensor signal transduction histidine kinase [Alkalicoccus daliensis]
MNSYRFRLIVPLSLIILIVLSSLGALLGPFIQEFYQERMNDRVQKEASIVSFALAQVDYTDEEILQETTMELSQRLDARITIIAADGEVLAESAVDPAQMENHLDRPEIIGAQDDTNPFEVRYSDTINRELLFYAEPLVIEEENIGYLRLGLEMRELNEVYQNIWTLLIISFFIAFIVILLFITKVTNQLIKPIEDARRVANELARGNFSARTYEGLHIETGELNRSINVLAENLDQITKTYENQQERLETLIENMGSGLILINSKGDITLMNRSCKDIFEEDTDEWKNQLYYHAIQQKKVIKFIQELFLIEKPIRKQMKWSAGIYIRHFDVHGAPIVGNDGQLKGMVLVFHDITELKKLEQARKDFVANVSHELKTPVTSLKGFTETLLDGAMHDEALREKFLTIIAKESVRLEELIGDLLELSRIEGEHFELNWEEVNLQELTSEVSLMLSEKARAKKMEIHTKSEGDVTIPADASRLKQVMINLINNAIVYSPEGGEIFVRLKGQEENVVMEVTDTGIGISKKEIPRIFERFYRVDRARSRNSGGTGLGLAIVKHLAEAHHAKLSVDSKPGRGTTFRMVFLRKPFGDEK